MDDNAGDDPLPPRWAETLVLEPNKKNLIHAQLLAALGKAEKPIFGAIAYTNSYDARFELRLFYFALRSGIDFEAGDWREKALVLAAKEYFAPKKPVGRPNEKSASAHHTNRLLAIGRGQGRAMGRALEKRAERIHELRDALGISQAEASRRIALEDDPSLAAAENEVALSEKARKYAEVASLANTLKGTPRKRSGRAVKSLIGKRKTHPR